MKIPFYAAMTAAEFRFCPRVPINCAWMACCFSPGGKGLSNLPDLLPAGSMLIINDSIPCTGHDPALAAECLASAAEKLQCACILLDFQRPPEKESQAMAEKLAGALPCPVGMPPAYGKHLPCPLFLPPPPLHLSMETYFSKWKNRKLWLEAGFNQETVTVSETGAVFQTEVSHRRDSDGFYDKAQNCRYEIEISEDHIIFSLRDSPASLKKKLDEAERLGAAKIIGLYQELGPDFFRQV